MLQSVGKVPFYAPVHRGKFINFTRLDACTQVTYRFDPDENVQSLRIALVDKKASNRERKISADLLVNGRDDTAIVRKRIGKNRPRVTVSKTDFKVTGDRKVNMCMVLYELKKEIKVYLEDVLIGEVRSVNTNNAQFFIIGGAARDDVHLNILYT